MATDWTDILGYGTTGAAIGSNFGPEGTLVGAGIGALAGGIKGLFEPNQEINYQAILDKYRHLLQSQYQNVFEKQQQALKREYQRRGLSSSPALMAGLSRLKAGQAQAIREALDKMALQRMSAQEGDERTRLAREYQNYQQMWGRTIPQAATLTAYNFLPQTNYGTNLQSLGVRNESDAQSLTAVVQKLLNSPELSSWGRAQIQAIYNALINLYPNSTVR